MTVDLLEQAAARLGPWLTEIVFVGGATVSLWITDPAAPEFRPTLDVDGIVEVSGRADYLEIEERLQELGFRHDQESGVICRFLDSETDLVLDVMPTDASILGFENEWHGKAFPHAVPIRLPSGAEIKAVPPAFPLATKLEAFEGRGKGDVLASKDLADVVTLIDGREELVADFAEAPGDVRRFVSAALGKLVLMSDFDLAIAAHLKPDPSSQERATEIVIPRIEALAATG